jgi:hypothetical protein
MSPRRNWDSPTPSLASECAPPPGTKGHTCLRMRGWGSPNSDDRGEKAEHSAYSVKSTITLCFYRRITTSSLHLQNFYKSKELIKKLRDKPSWF